MNTRRRRADRRHHRAAVIVRLQTYRAFLLQQEEFADVSNMAQFVERDASPLSLFQQYGDAHNLMILWYRFSLVDMRSRVETHIRALEADTDDEQEDRDQDDAAAAAAAEAGEVEVPGEEAEEKKE